MRQRGEDDWSDWLLTIDQHTRNFNLSLQPACSDQDSSFEVIQGDELEQDSEWLELGLSDLLQDFLDSKLDSVANSLSQRVDLSDLSGLSEELN